MENQDTSTSNKTAIKKKYLNKNFQNTFQFLWQTAAIQTYNNYLNYFKFEKTKQNNLFLNYILRPTLLNLPLSQPFSTASTKIFKKIMKKKQIIN